MKTGRGNGGWEWKKMRQEVEEEMDLMEEKESIGEESEECRRRDGVRTGRVMGI